MNKILSVIFSFVLLSCVNQNDKKEILYKNPQISVEKRVSDLLSKMTLEEKVLQLNQYTLGTNNNVNNIGEIIDKIPDNIGSLIYFDSDPSLRNKVQKKAVEESRLGIPILFGYDVIHGYRTIYPISLAQACSWNPDLVKKACSVAAVEARASGVDWTFSPMIDVARDGRWGRVAEGYGEDPYANAVFGVASVKGYQGDDLTDTKHIASCLKHYVGYSASEAGMDYVYSEVSRQSLWNVYLPPYEAGVKAGAVTLMSSFNDISGIPGSANHYTLTKILKEKWQHKGFVVSDWGAVKQLRSQGCAADNKEAALKAFNAGVEMDMVDRCYTDHLAELVKEGAVTMDKIDDAVSRVLRLKFQLGLFENPYTEEIPETERYLQSEDISIAQWLAEESIVLLKNDETLPLKKNTKIAVIGPMAKSRVHQLGSWSAHGKEEDVISIYDGLKENLSVSSNLLYAMGCDFEGDDKSGFAEALAVAKKANVIILCLGEKKEWSGENASRSTLALPQIQEDLLLKLSKTGKKIVLVLSNGRPIELCRIENECSAIVEAWQPGIAAGKAVANVLTGIVNPSGKLAITFPYSTGQIPIYYNRRQSARPNQGKYQDIQSEPMYEFGHGLSYTSFKYGEMKVSNTEFTSDELIHVEIDVQNTGNMDGAEVVQLFISDPVCTYSRPVKELKKFDKKFIKKGDRHVFQFEINPHTDLAYYDEEGNPLLEEGDFYLMIKDQKVKIKMIR